MLKDLKCNSGAYIEIIPVGLNCTLQYNGNGILQKIIQGFHEFGSDTVDKAEIFSSELLVEFMKSHKVPHRIPFSSGNIWIKGVFYTKKYFKIDGVLPDCLQDKMMEDLKKNPGDYTLYACDLNSDSYNFLGGPIISISTRLTTFGFNSVPGYQVYDGMSMLPVEKIMKEKKSPFTFPYISGIFVYGLNTNSEYIPAKLEQHTVNSVEEYLESHGFLRAVISLDDRKIDVPYSDIVRFDITSKTVLIMDGDKILTSRKPSSFFNNKVSRNKDCPICHKKMIVPHSGYTHCGDDHCPSRIYPAFSHFLRTLGLTSMNFDNYIKLAQKKSITCILDVFSLEEYQDVMIECTLSNLLFAIVPFEICRSIEFFQQFTNYLGSLEAFDFYLSNPDAIVKDLHLNKMYATNFANWLKDSENLLMIRTLITMEDHIKILPVRQKFEGDPIFRGKSICLTGKFKRGTLEDIISILQSYSAKVVTTFDNTVNCVVLGHFECEDKDLIDLAVSYGIPIYGEDDFFTSYDIDKDLQNHYE